jgi:hypothetical protein
MKSRKHHVLCLSALLLMLMRASSSHAQGAPSADDLAKQTQNPVASLITAPLQGNWDFGIGDRDATAALLNFQPVIPFAISSSTNIILRVIMPLTSQPGADGLRINGLGDMVVSAFFSPSKGSRITWGVGPVMLLPTATSNALGTEKFGIGPTAVVLTQPGKWTVGLLANQIWSTSGPSDRTDVNQTFLQPFLSYNLGKGLAAGVAMEASGNWKADEVWTAPLLFVANKVTALGKQPVQVGVSAGPMVAGPAAGASWRFRFSVTFLFPSGAR